jgi:hypothetical protein
MLPFQGGRASKPGGRDAAGALKNREVSFAFFSGISRMPCIFRYAQMYFFFSLLF